MDNQIYFAEDDLRDVEEKIYHLVQNQGFKELDPEEILEKLFIEGTSFKGWKRDKIKRRIVRYLKNWSDYELKTLETSKLYDDLQKNSRKEGLLLLKQYLRLASKSLGLAFDNAYHIAFKLIDKPWISAFISVLSLASYYQTLEDLQNARKTREHIKKLINQEEIYLFNRFETFEEIQENVEEKKQEKTHEEDKGETQVEEEGSLFEKFISTIDYILELPDNLSKDKIKEIFRKRKVKLEDMLESQLIAAFLSIAASETLHMIEKDEYMKEVFYTSDIEDLMDLCKTFNDLSSKDCQLVYLTYLWMLAELSFPDLYTFNFIQERIEFTNNGNILVELIKEELERRKALEKERLALWRKKHRRKKTKMKIYFTEDEIVIDHITNETFNLREELGIWTWDGSIYILKDLSKKEKVKIAVHEIIEYFLVVKLKIKRSLAHKIAELAERLII